eukprot:CAMPEP_0168355716 /NCGR_PEP_ID=MMETSP0213-20121227/24732_1 /TAXON_ID=151035 /ORGANISM="Euplotes harpa, Strain FSP1.4" /LENGTH=167 /DNA_ID=CAMNT_0008368011 /DNA_START=9 /DNA_END=513 /DNA_ORIENTATION=-
MEIWLVRHGETFGNKKMLIQGHSGGTLTPLGEQQEKGGGVLEGEPLHRFRNDANKSFLPFREYKAEGGESWNDVHNRAKEFFTNLCKTHFYGEETKDFVVDIRKAVEIGDDYSSLKDEEQKMPEEEEKSTKLSEHLSGLSKENIMNAGSKDSAKINPETRKILGNLK